MEKKIGPGDLELNQEKLLVVQDELRRLQYDMKKKEMNRNSVHSKMQQCIRQQWDTISDLKKQKSELTLQLRLQESESFSNQASQNIKNFKKSLNEVIKLEKQIKDQTEELNKCKKEIADFDRKVRQKQKDVIKAQRSKGRVLAYQRNVSFLENRLNSSLQKYNQLLATNKSLRDEINSLLLTQSQFRRKYGSIKRLLAMGRKTLSEVVHSATVSYQTGESVKYKLNVIKERTQVDQKRLGEKIKELKIMVEQDKQMKEFLEFKSKERAGAREVEEQALKNEQIMEQKLQTYQGVLARIQLASGCKDVGRVCKAFVQGEEENLALFEKVNEASLEIEKLHEEVRAQRKELEEVTGQYKEQRRKDLAVKHDIEAATDKLRTDAIWLEDTADTRAEELECVKEIMNRIYQLLGTISSQEVAFTVDQSITDDNILQYLETMERRIVDVIHCNRLVEMKDDCIITGNKYFQNQLPSYKKLQKPLSQIGRKPSNCMMNENDEGNHFAIPYNKKNLEDFAKTCHQKPHHCRKKCS